MTTAPALLSPGFTTLLAGAVEALLLVVVLEDSDLFLYIFAITLASLILGESAALARIYGADRRDRIAATVGTRTFALNLVIFGVVVVTATLDLQQEKTEFLSYPFFAVAAAGVLTSGARLYVQRLVGHRG